MRSWRGTLVLQALDEIGRPARLRLGALFTLTARGATPARTTLPLGVLRENVVLRLRYRVAREPALGVIPLRRLIR
jgi:hypothetical protein